MSDRLNMTFREFAQLSPNQQGVLEREFWERYGSKIDSALEQGRYAWAVFVGTSMEPVLSGDRSSTFPSEERLELLQSEYDGIVRAYAENSPIEEFAI